jgi:hypothetical protein
MSKSEQRRYGRLTALASIAAIGASLVALAGCGGSSTPKPAADSTQASTTGTSELAARSGTSGAGGTHSKGSQAAGGQTGQRKHNRGDSVQKVTAGATAEADASARKPPQPHPCNLVRLSEAQTITGGRIADTTEAPLGPTCIFKLSRPKADITLAVEKMSFSQVTHQMSTRKSVRVRGRWAYCGKLGAQMLFVPLSKGQLLNVTAPCPVAQQFAEHALGRLVS